MSPFFYNTSRTLIGSLLSNLYESPNNIGESPNNIGEFPHRIQEAWYDISEGNKCHLILIEIERVFDRINKFRRIHTSLNNCF